MNGVLIFPFRQNQKSQNKMKGYGTCMHQQNEGINRKKITKEAERENTLGKKQAEKSQEKINKIIGELENEVECFCSTTGKAYIQITEGEENHVVIPIDERKLVEQAFRENRKIINEAVISAISLLAILEEYMKQTGSKREIESAPTEFYKDLKLFAMMANIRLQEF